MIYLTCLPEEIVCRSANERTLDGNNGLVPKLGEEYVKLARLPCLFNHM